MFTTPLWSAAEDDGAANFGRVSAFSPPPVVVRVVVGEEPEVVAPAELPVELLEDPQPAASASAAQAISVEMPLPIGVLTLA
jgi:hypothetical protein